MRFSVGLPQTVAGPDVIRFARRAEELGFDGLWTMDNAIGGQVGHYPSVDGLHALTFAAGVTDAIRLGIAVIVLPRRNPLLLARELASIDRLSGGRLVVGVGLGAADEERAVALGFPAGPRVRRLVEGVGVLRSVWTQPGRPTTASGSAWSPSRSSSRTRRSGSARASRERCAAR